ncbi:hypothetical protein Clacol_008464 [Clathrus columnatus]|uniref:BTB domain-containing protein n=1 Tax=Clathrus columnatus TaxID=1419009 RepID=A0AAV5AKL4_9AGAM|nr:hypothetical protein Clacol_008464 [Clathrus columnatus]
MVQMSSEYHGPKDLYIKSSKYYLLTGDVVMISGRIAFKVHRENIVNKSSLFRMLLNNSLRSPRVYFDNCPVIKVLENPEDLKKLLEVMYRPDICSTFSADGIDLLGVMKSSFRHGLKDIFDLCHERLTHFFPTQLEEWDPLCREARPNPYLVIQLSRRINKAIFLPAAFYYLTIAFPPLLSAVSKLTSKDYNSYLVMKKTLIDRCSRFLANEGDVLQTCGDPTCFAIWNNFQQHYQQKTQSPLYGFILNDPLSQLLDYIEELEFNLELLQLCPLNKNEAITRAGDERRRMWGLLPQFLDYDSWQTVKNADLAFRIGFEHEMVYPETNVREIITMTDEEFLLKTSSSTYLSVESNPVDSTTPLVVDPTHLNNSDLEKMETPIESALQQKETISMKSMSSSTPSSVDEPITLQDSPVALNSLEILKETALQTQSMQDMDEIDNNNINRLELSALDGNNSDNGHRFSYNKSGHPQDTQAEEKQAELVDTLPNELLSEGPPPHGNFANQLTTTQSEHTRSSRLSPVQIESHLLSSEEPLTSSPTTSNPNTPDSQGLMAVDGDNVIVGSDADVDAHTGVDVEANTGTGGKPVSKPVVDEVLPNPFEFLPPASLLGVPSSRPHTASSLSSRAGANVHRLPSVLRPANRHAYDTEGVRRASMVGGWDFAPPTLFATSTDSPRYRTVSLEGVRSDSYSIPSRPQSSASWYPHYHRINSQPVYVDTVSHSNLQSHHQRLNSQPAYFNGSGNSSFADFADTPDFRLSTPGYGKDQVGDEKSEITASTRLNEADAEMGMAKEGNENTMEGHHDNNMTKPCTDQGKQRWKFWSRNKQPSCPSDTRAEKTKSASNMPPDSRLKLKKRLSPDSLAEDIDLLLASIGLLSSIVEGGGSGKKPQENDLVTTTTARISKPIHDKVPPCDVPRGPGEESCPPSPAVQLHLDLPKRFSDQETVSPSSEGSARPSLLTPQASLSLGDELLSSISPNSPDSTYPSRLHIEEHLETARSSQVLPLTPIETIQEKPLPAPLNTTMREGMDLKTPKSQFMQFSDVNGPGTAVPEAESPVIRNLREFSKLYDSKKFLFGAHSRARSTNDITQFSTQRIRPGRVKPLDGEHAISMIEVLPPVPKTPPPIPPTPEGRTLSRQNSMKALPSQLRYQLSKGSLRQLPPTRLRPLNHLDDKPRPQTEFRADEAATPGPSRDPRFGHVPYTSPAVQTQFPIQTTSTSAPLMEQDEPSSVESAYSSEQVLHIHRPLPQRQQSQHMPPSPSAFSEVSMTRSDPDPEGDGDMLDDDDDAQSYMSNPLDGMRSPISPDQTIFLEGRPRVRRDDSDRMAQPVSFFDLGFEMDIGRLKKHSRWKFWSKM